MKKRNKRTLIVGDHQISPLTKHILDRMGREGLIIRQRLEQFYQHRSNLNQPLGNNPPNDTPPIEFFDNQTG
ncbi:MAG: hypothetical protein PHW74_01140 [Desulfobacca sp.]|nr:hypothetical protein [Desulfobacca sp.]